MIKNKDIQVIVFDADDTLWSNEPYFRETEAAFCRLLAQYLPQTDVERILLRIEIANIPLYGYGIKAFILSMIETALEIAGDAFNADLTRQILALGTHMLNQPVVLLEDIEHVLQQLRQRYRLVVATKGDLLDQERKLKKSGLAHYFHHIEVMSEKDEASYLKLVKHLDVPPGNMLMVGNSLKSDILPVLGIGGHALHIPFHTTWIHETVSDAIEHDNLYRAETFTQLLSLV
ncbi:HAD family hydrolase [Deminuibacter soli]|uniref:HAD family hydrolase n=1 Tax=Deminuibacter soli TaxID=2291815 RepID=A0A3E1NCW9_9BACT|nr:HAD family hydrolase [Deminuibacter soli]RFM25664.1 HAD family hydrolase [Deminuibacter soli]